MKKERKEKKNSQTAVAHVSIEFNDVGNFFAVFSSCLYEVSCWDTHAIEVKKKENFWYSIEQQNNERKISSTSDTHPPDVW